MYTSSFCKVAKHYIEGDYVDIIHCYTLELDY